MGNKVVSIITPSFNRADLVDETAQSIFSQTCPHWEWMIVDDGSTDNSWELLERYAAQDARVKILKRDRLPKGAAACRNIAIENSTGDYLIFLDTDDLLTTFCLEQRVKAAEENPECDFIVFPMLLFKVKPDDTRMLWNIDKEEDEVNRLLFGDPLCQGTGTIWKKKSFVDIGMWDEKLMLWQDIELHLRALLGGMKYKKRMDLLPDIFLRISEQSLSRTGYHDLPKLKSRIKVFTDTAQTVVRLKKLDAYRPGLRSMGFNLIVSSINSSFFEEGKSVLNFCKQHELLTAPEASVFTKYLQSRKFKLYKLPLIAKKNNNKIKALIKNSENTLGTIPYSQPIIL
jgi:glycosyltransferase involved in cell wall biosynthesis